MTQAPFVKEVAAPGSVFWETVRHPENVIILEGDDRARKLPKDRLLKAERQLQVVQHALNIYLRAYIDHLRKMQAQIDDQAKLEKIAERIAYASERIVKTKKPNGKPYVINNPIQAREGLVLASRLRSRIEEHYKAIENEELNRKLQDEMLGEISFYANQIVERWSALGYREEYFVEGKRILRKVKIEEAHFTEDNIQFKIYVSHLTLLGSTVHHLPDKVRAWDLVKPETLRELEAACECPVTSPHTDEEQGFEHGAWIVVHRVGMRDGLFNYVELNKVLAKYNQALRPRFAVPVGIKAGRLIEYLYLDKTPHLMFNGITGSGKTNAARVFLSVWSQFYSPDEIRFVLIDLKRSGDLNYFAKLPHLVTDIVKKMTLVEELLPRLVVLMQQRMDLFSARNVVDIEQYNKKAEPADRLPRIVVLIDECGAINDLSESVAQKDLIWRCLALLAAQARAAGIHLMLGTQQPAKDVIPTRVTNNITYTLSGRQRTTSGAMTALGNNRLKELPAIQGRMLVDNGFGLFPVQTPYATESDLAQAVAAGMNYPAPQPLVLPGDEDVEQALGLLSRGEKHIDEETGEIIRSRPALGVNRERLLDVTLNELAGVLSAEKTYQLTDHVTPRAAIAELIKQVVEEKTVSYAGADYDVKPLGKGYRLELRKTEKPKHGGSDLGVSSEESDGVLPDGFSKNEDEQGLEEAV